MKLLLLVLLIKVYYYYDVSSASLGLFESVFVRLCLLRAVVLVLVESMIEVLSSSED
jgi:hypothetical protein